MPVQINPSKIPIWISDTELRLGTSDESQVIQQVTNAQERLINLLFEGVAESQVGLLGRSVGLEEHETEDLIERLRPSLLLNAGSEKSRATVDVRFAELIRIGFQTDQSPTVVLSKRARTRICLEQLDRTGLNLLRILCELGFREFETNDYELVCENDLGELGYPMSLRSVSRLAAARAIVDADDSRVEIVHATAKKPAALNVISATHRLMPKDYQNMRVPHLAIEYQMDSVFVSGMLIPSTTACLGCRGRWAAEGDPLWPSESIQLNSRNDQLDDGASVLMACALTARNICNFVDFEDLGIGNLVDIRSRQIKESSHQSHPGCSCGSTTPAD